MEHNTDTFWQWFISHNEKLTMLSDLHEDKQQRLLDQMQHQLDLYCEGLSFEIGDASTSGRTLTFSAEGDTELFRFVIDLVDNAPDLDWWQFVAFKQPMGTELKVNFDNTIYDTRKMYFRQLECEEEPDMLGLQVALPNYVPDSEEQEIGVYVTIEALIGEFDCATLLGYLETIPLPDEPFKAGLNPLDDLPRMVEWFKTQRDM